MNTNFPPDRANSFWQPCTFIIKPSISVPTATSVRMKDRANNCHKLSLGYPVRTIQHKAGSQVLDWD